MTRINNQQLKQLIIRKCGIICVLIIFTLLSFYTQGTNKLNQSKDIQTEVNNEASDSFYFLTGDQEQRADLGEIDQKNPLNPLNIIIKEDQSLLRNSLRKKFKNSLIKNNSNKLKRSKRQANEKNNKQNKLKTNLNDNRNQLKNSENRFRKKRSDEDEEDTGKKETNKKQPSKTDEDVKEENNKNENDNEEEYEDTEIEEGTKNDKEENNENKEKEEKENKKEIDEKIDEKIEEVEEDNKLTKEERERKLDHLRKRKLRLNKNNEVCTPAAAKEFPPDIFSHKLRKRGFIIIHFAVTCYMFFCLAIVCDKYFLPSLELCSSKLGLSNDVAGATFMAAGSSAPELFAAILGVFIAKSDVGTGTIVGSAIFNILFVIGLCGVCAASVQLNWWPVARDSSYYCLTVFVLIIVAYDGQVSTMESSFMLLLYVGYVLTMYFNQKIYEIVIAKLGQYDSDFSDKIMNVDTNASRSKFDNMGSSMYRSFQEESFNLPNVTNILPPSQHLNKTSMFEAACHVIIKHDRLFRPLTRFRAAADLIVIQNRKHKIAQYESKNLGTLSRQESVLSRRKVSIAEEDIEEYWRNVPNYQEVGPLLFAKWIVIAPLYATLFFTIPDCKKNRSLFLATFLVSIIWISLFSYLMVWMVTTIGFTFGIPDAIMGLTLLAAGTSVPDAYTSLHVAKLGEGDMAVSNSIGSNVFDILVGLALPFFLETTIVSPGLNATINSKGLFYAICLLFLSLVVTIYLFYMNRWVLNKKLGILMIISYFVILLLCIILEFNIIDVNNALMCDD